VFVSALRHAFGLSAPLRRSLKPELFAARAALEGREAFGEYTDYRGAKVLAVTRHLRVAGWGMVTKIDYQEAFAGFRRTALLQVALFALFVLAFLGFTIALHRYQQVHVLTSEIARREQAERELASVNRVLLAVTECIQALIRSKDEATLLRDVCRIIVEVGGYRFAWVGYAEQDENKSVWPVAHAGLEEGYLETVQITWADTERGRGPAGTAIRTAKPAFARNISTDPEFAPWRAEAMKRGFASSVALPLVSDGQGFGALMIYAGGPDAFDEREIALLTGMASDLAYGVAALRTRAEHQRAEEALDFLFCRGAYGGRAFESPPKVVLLDLKLPKVDGLEVLRELKADPRTNPIPVVILTSSREERDMISGYQLGVNSYLQKPVDFEQFRDVVKQLGLYWMVVNQPPPAEAFSSG
jgi:CheY-like chemotaxis protein